MRRYSSCARALHDTLRSRTVTMFVFFVMLHTEIMPQLVSYRYSLQTHDTGVYRRNTAGISPTADYLFVSKSQYTVIKCMTAENIINNFFDLCCWN